MVIITAGSVCAPTPWTPVQTSGRQGWLFHTDRTEFISRGKSELWGDDFFMLLREPGSWPWSIGLGPDTLDRKLKVISAKSSNICKAILRIVFKPVVKRPDSLLEQKWGLNSKSRDSVPASTFIQHGVPRICALPHAWQFPHLWWILRFSRRANFLLQPSCWKTVGDTFRTFSRIFWRPHSWGHV